MNVIMANSRSHFTHEIHIHFDYLKKERETEGGLLPLGLVLVSLPLV